MAKKPNNDLQPMTEDQLEGTVGGITTISTKPGTSAGTGKLTQVADIVAIDTNVVMPAASLTTKASISGTNLIQTEQELAAVFTGTPSRGNGVAALNGAVDNAVVKLTAAGYDPASAKSLAWSSAYDQMAKGAKSVFDSYPEVKKEILSHSEDISKGIAIAVGATQDLAGALTKATNLLSEAGAKLRGPELDSFLAKGSSALESGFKLLADTREGKAVLGVIGDPKSVDAWKDAISETAVSLYTPKLLTRFGALCSLVEGGAMAKVFGADAPSEVKQVANAVSSTIAGLQDVFAAGYKSGYLGMITNTGGMLYEASKNVLELGKAMASGNPEGMKNAVIALGTDLFNDYKNLCKSFYIDTPKQVVEGLGKVIGTCLDKLGATPYANEAAAVTAKALKDFGEMAKSGATEAVKAVGDFARNGVNGAANAAEDLAKQGVKGAMDVMSSLASEGKVAISTMENLVKSGANGAAAALEDLAKKGVNGAVAGVEHMVKDGKMAMGVLENLAKSGVNGAVSSIESLAKQGVNGAASAIESLAKAGTRGAMDAAEELVKGGKMAVSTIENLAKQGVNGAVDAIDHLARAGSNEAVKALGNLASSGVAAAGAALAEVAKLGVASDALRTALSQVMSSGQTVVINALVNEAAKFAKTVDNCAEVLRVGIDKGSKAALDAATSIAKTAVGNAQLILFDGIGKAVFKGGAYAESAINELNKIAKTTGNTAELAVRTLGNMAGQGGQAAQVAVNALSDIARSGVQQADNAVHTLGNMAKAGTKAAVDALSEVGRGVTGTAKLAVSTLESAAKSGVNEAKNALVTLGNDGIKAAQDVINASGKFFEDVKDKLGNWFDRDKWGWINPTKW